MEIRLRPIRADEVEILYGFSQDRATSGHMWAGFRSVSGLAREHAEHGFLGEDVGRLMVDVDGAAAGFVSYTRGRYGIQGDYFDIGAALLPDFRGRGIGWRAQALLTAYLFEHKPVQRIQAGTQAENVAEQKALVKAGFRLEGVIRAAEFRAGQWRDCLLYSRLRHDPGPEFPESPVS
jgi:RimJ/RimL family protein N-acetyltransferase